jgi:hypothetical protein
MDLQYVKELEKQGLQVKDLPEDARTGIKEINKALSFIKMGEAKGKTASPDAIKKIKAMDKWVLYEIYDIVEDTDKNEDEIPYESDDVEDDLDNELTDSSGLTTENEEDDNENNEDDNEEIKKQSNLIQTNADVNKINNELYELYKNNKTELKIDEIKTYAPTVYKAIFDVYKSGEVNGVQSDKFSLLETKEQEYKLEQI